MKKKIKFKFKKQKKLSSYQKLKLEIKILKEENYKLHKKTTFGMEKIIDGKTELQGKGYKPTEIMIDENHFAELDKNSDFHIFKECIGTNITNIIGLKLIVSSNVSGYLIK